MISLWLTGLVLRVQTRVAGAGPERGDVPGWVMITVMTAAVAMILWGLASNKFQELFNNAFSSVGPGSH